MVKDTLFEKKRLLNCNGKYLDLSQPRIMGILNITPDSFYDGGRYTKAHDIQEHCRKLVHEGADIVDIGAFSSRPGAEEVSETEEKKRLLPALEIIRNEFPEILLSVDTCRASVAFEAIRKFRVNMINDISAGEIDREMYPLIAENKAAYVLMHMRGTPKTMQSDTSYLDLVQEIIEYLGRKSESLRGMGVTDMVIDPGFGFGKTVEQNFQLLGHLDAFRILRLPTLVGLSRKSMIYKFLEKTASEALNGTTVLNTLALQSGADILRVHDVQAARECIRLFIKTMDEKNKYLEQNTL